MCKFTKHPQNHDNKHTYNPPNSPRPSCFSLFFVKIYLFEREQESEHEQGEGADSPLSREPDLGLDPRILRS